LTPNETAMASLDSGGNVIYVGTLTKTLAPAIRIGFIAAPRGFIAAAAQFRRVLDWQGDSVLEAAIAGLFRDGTIQRHIRKSVRIYRERRDNFCRLLVERLGERARFSVPEGGMSVWTTFTGARVKEVAARASALDVLRACL